MPAYFVANTETSHVQSQPGQLNDLVRFHLKLKMI